MLCTGVVVPPAKQDQALEGTPKPVCMPCDALCLPCFAIRDFLAYQQEACEEGGASPHNISHESVKKGMPHHTELVLSV